MKHQKSEVIFYLMYFLNLFIFDFCVSTKENASYLCTVHEVVIVLYARRFHDLDTILDWPGTFCLDLMCSVFSHPGAGIYFVTLVHR